MLFYQLTRPVAYLFIKDSSKSRIDWVMPFVVSVIVTALYSQLPNPPKFYGENGLIKELQGFLQLLPGFYLAALGAIATFNKNDLDFELPKPTPQITIRIIRSERINEIDIGLTRRRMLSYLFGYLTFLSLMLYLGTVFGSSVSGSFSQLAGEYSCLIKIFLLWVFNLFFFQMIIITVFGLYQLCDRIHQPDDNPEEK